MVDQVSDAQNKVPAPSGTRADAQSDVVKLQARIEELSKLREADVAKVKSALQKQIDTAQRGWETERKQLLEQLRQARLEATPEEKRGQLQQQFQSDDTRAVSEENQRLRDLLELQQTMTQWREYFVSQGVDPAKLDMSSPEALTQSGWAAITDELQSLRQGKGKETSKLSKKEQPPAEGEEETPAPNIATISTTGKPVDTMAALAKKYGSLEKVFSLVEQGKLDPKVVEEAAASEAGA